MADKDEKMEGPQAGTPAPLDAVVDQWIVDYFPESVITRDSQGWQLFQQAAMVLKQRLKGE